MSEVYPEDGPSLPVWLFLQFNCSWISNCVGARNQKPFMLFLLYVGLAEGMAIVMTIKYCIFYKRRFQVPAVVSFDVAILPLDSYGVHF